MKNLIGKRVLINGSRNHPWRGEVGVVNKKENTLMGKVGYIVELDNGTSCFVFNESELQILAK